MALQASGNPISAQDIANEFGYNFPLTGITSGTQFSLGTYRKIGFGQSDFPQVVGELSFGSIDSIGNGGSVPTSGEISFADFYSTRLQQVVNSDLDLMIHQGQKYIFMSINRSDQKKREKSIVH